MYFYVKEYINKRNRIGIPKELTLDTKEIDGNIVNSYKFSSDRFIRPAKSSYRINFYISCKNDGRNTSMSFSIANLNYYDIAEGYDDYMYDLGGLYYQLLKKVYSIIEDLNFSDEEIVKCKDEASDLLSEKIEFLFEKIGKEFSETEEGKIFIRRKEIFNEYEERKRKFLSTHDAYDTEYDMCYNLYGELTNPKYLEEIEMRIKE